LIIEGVNIGKKVQSTEYWVRSIHSIEY